jgi:two-component system, OmpR family, osmolarity sensor histidine kinase EnvZ
MFGHSYVRVTLIVIAASIVFGLEAFYFMERHWNQVARRLSEATARDIAAIVDLYEVSSTKEDVVRLIDIGRNRFGLAVVVLPAGALPSPQPKPFFDLVDRALSEDINANVKRPFWIDTVGQSRHVEVRIKLDHANLRFVAPRGQVYASNSHIFALWMISSSIVLLLATVVLMRKPS